MKSVQKYNCQKAGAIMVPFPSSVDVQHINGVEGFWKVVIFAFFGKKKAYPSKWDIDRRYAIDKETWPYQWNIQYRLNETLHFQYVIIIEGGALVIQTTVSINAPLNNVRVEKYPGFSLHHYARTQPFSHITTRAKLPCYYRHREHEKTW